MNNEYIYIASEIQELKSLLSSIPQGNIIERMSLESRLFSAEQTLKKIPQAHVNKKARLTFRGRPVLGSHGIAADFAAKAAGAFSDAFTAISASLNEGLRHIGPIPNKDKNQLLITGTAIGSFGFEFELPPYELSLFPESNQPEKAMRKIETLFRLAAEGTDDEVAEVIEEVHPRAVKKVYEFLDILVQQNAWCGLEFENRLFRYNDYEHLKNSSCRLKDDNIKEAEEVFLGEFQGVLPTGRAFEFKLSDQKGLIRGKLDISIDDPDNLNRQWLHKPVTIKLNMMQVGEGRPRYTLMSLDNITKYNDDIPCKGL